MNTPMYLYSVSRNDVAPSEMASCKSAAFWTICAAAQLRHFSALTIYKMHQLVSELSSNENCVKFVRRRRRDRCSRKRAE